MQEVFLFLVFMSYLLMTIFISSYMSESEKTFDRVREDALFRYDTSNIMKIIHIFSLSIVIGIMYIFCSSIVFSIFMLNSNKYKEMEAQSKEIYINEKRDVEKNKLEFDRHLDGGYKIIAKFKDGIYFYPSLEKCSDKDTVIYFNSKYEVTNTIENANFIICK